MRQDAAFEQGVEPVFDELRQVRRSGACGASASEPGEVMEGGAAVAPADEILVELAKLGETRTREPGTAVVTEGDVAGLRCTIIGCCS